MLVWQDFWSELGSEAHPQLRFGRMSLRDDVCDHCPAAHPQLRYGRMKLREYVCDVCGVGPPKIHPQLRRGVSLTLTLGYVHAGLLPHERPQPQPPSASNRSRNCGFNYKGRVAATAVSIARVEGGLDKTRKRSAL